MNGSKVFIGMVEYNEVEYHSLPYDDYVKTTIREGLIERSLELWKSGEASYLALGLEES